MCCQATKPCMGSLACNLLKLVQALPGTPPGRAAVYRAGPQAGRLGWLSRPGRAPMKWGVAHSLDARPHISTLHHCGPVVQWPRRASIINRENQSTLLYKGWVPLFVAIIYQNQVILYLFLPLCNGSDLKRFASMMCLVVKYFVVWIPSHRAAPARGTGVTNLRSIALFEA